jgi:hypothetical protein
VVIGKTRGIESEEYEEQGEREPKDEAAEAGCVIRHGSPMREFQRMIRQSVTPDNLLLQ